MYSVLYVDDEPVLLELGKTFLEMSGSLRVETATSATEAIGMLGTRPVDCIVSDYQMPEMDGIAFLKYIRTHFGPLPFILFTGRGREEIVIEAFANAADFYLQKGGDPTAQFVELEHKIKLAIERRRIQEELKGSRQRMSDIIDHLPDATFAIDLDHRVIAWNLAMEEMTGVRKEEILGSADQSYAIPFYGIKRPLLLDLILKDDPEIAKEYPYITRKGNKLISEIFIPVLNHGKGAYMWFIASPLYDAEGQVVGAIESIRDVTGPHKTNDELMASQERYRAVVEDQTEFISRFRPDGTHIFVNDAYCRYFGRRPEEIIGTKFRPDVFPEDTEKIKKHLRSLTPEHPEKTIEHRILMPGGAVRWQQWSDRAIFDEKGNVREYQSVGRDITDQRRAEDELRRAYEELTANDEEMRAQFEELRFREEALRQSERKLQGIVQGSPIPQFVIDKDHRVISWNHALEVYSGIRASDILGTTDPWMAFYPKKRPVLADLILDNSVDEIARWYAGKYHPSKYVEGAFEATDFFPHMGTGGKWLFFTAAAIRDSSGAVIGAVETLEDVTDIKQKEDELRASEEKYRTILDDMQDTYYRSDREGNLIMFSPSGIRLLGYDSPDEVLGKPIATTFYYNPEQRSEFLAAIERDGAVTGMEIILKRKDGTRVLVSTSSHRYLDQDGNFAGVEGIFRDITGQKQSEEALRQSEEKYRSLFENTGTAMVLIEEDTTIRIANAELCHLTGYSREEIEGKMSWTRLVVREDLDRMLVQHRLRRERQEEALKNYEFRLLTKTGGIRYMYLTIDIIPGTKQSVASLMDITGQKVAEDALRQSEEKYRSLFESTGTAMVLIEDNTVISIANDEFIRISGYSREEIEGKMSWTSLVVREDLDRMLAQHRLRRERKEDALRNYEFRLLQKSGGIRNIYLTIDVIAGTKQSVASLMDITEKVRAQESLNAANRKLSLLNSITRHDILNQLMSLFGFLELVNRQVTDPAILSYLERERRAAESIRSHIEFTRDYQDIGVRAPEWQRAGTVIGEAGRSVNLKGIDLAVDVGDVEVFADLLLQKVFYTLIENSLRHGGGVTRIQFSAMEREGELVLVCEDNGIGIPSAAKEKIFHRQYYQNTGLGLFLSSEILGITGLSLRETGTEGKGARFEIRVPKEAFRHPAGTFTPDRPIQPGS